MKIAFAKIKSQKICVFLDDVSLDGKLSRKHNLVHFVGKLYGKLHVQCSSCGSDFGMDLDDAIELWLHDGVYEQEDGNFKDVIEFYDSCVDFDELLSCELESIRADYHYCESCLRKD